DQQRNESDHRDAHDDLLRRFLFCRRPAAQPAPEQGRVVLRQITGEEHRRAEENAEIEPSLPVIEGARRDEQQEGHADGEKDEAAARPDVEIVRGGHDHTPAWLALLRTPTLSCNASCRRARRSQRRKARRGTAAPRGPLAIQYTGGVWVFFASLC